MQHYPNVIRVGSIEISIEKAYLPVFLLY